MEGFPKDSEQFLKKPSDFTGSAAELRPDNDNHKRDLDLWERRGPEQVAQWIQKANVDPKTRANIMARVASGEITADSATALLLGLSEKFLQLYLSAIRRADDADHIAVQGMMTHYSDWEQDDLIDFANDPKNIPLFQKNPLLVVALWKLIL